eukprot:gene919-38976_t
MPVQGLTKVSPAAELILKAMARIPSAAAYTIEVPSPTKVGWRAGDELQYTDRDGNAVVWRKSTFGGGLI